MHNIQDLHFIRDIAPLFDFAGNERSRDVLLDLLSDCPSSLAGVIERQDILKAFLQNDPHSTRLPYSRGEFEAAYDYFGDLSDRGAVSELITVETIRLSFATTERHRLRSRLAQFFIFLHNIQQHWFRSAQQAPFPASFAIRIDNIKTTLATLDVAGNGLIARRHTFSAGQIVSLQTNIRELISNGAMHKFWQDLFIFEAYWSIAKGIAQHRFRFPSFNQSFSILDLFHPLLQKPVTNSIDIKENVNLLTGPNMAGKSTFLKTLGLCVHMAHLGLAVPATRCTLPFFDHISVSIDLRDDLQSGYSHFMNEVVSLKKVVTAAAGNQKCFAIFDELFRGTNPEDALAISATTITGLQRFGNSIFFISTHLHQLKHLLTNIDTISAWHIECLLDQDHPRFTYRLGNGWSDIRIGQLIFEKEGLNALLSPAS